MNEIGVENGDGDGGKRQQVVRGPLTRQVARQPPGPASRERKTRRAGELRTGNPVHVEGMYERKKQHPQRRRISVRDGVIEGKSESARNAARELEMDEGIVLDIPIAEPRPDQCEQAEPP